MKMLILVCLLSLASVTSTQAKTLFVAVGDRIYVEHIRSPCSGGQPPTIERVRSWLTQAPKHGKLEMGAPVKVKSNSCGKSLWMRKLYYRASSKGADTISIRFPEAGVLRWQVQVR